MIRQATLFDVENISRLINEAWQKDLISLITAEASESLSVEKFASKLSEDIFSDIKTVIVHEIDGQIAGYASGNVDVKDFDSEIVGLYVSPQTQQRGVGSHLFDEMKSVFESKRKSNMIVWTLLDAPNNKFYLKHNPVKLTHRDIIISGTKHRGIGFVYLL